MIRHLVFLRFADDMTRQDRDALMVELAALRDEIDGIDDFCARPNVSPETAFNRGMSEMFWFDFRDARARDAYLANETHRAIGARLFDSLDGGADGILVCDVEI